jgi:lysophospholipase L1-like esterase
MIKDFTDDGGHLNTKGQKVISKELIEKIFEIITMKKSIN